MNRIEFDSIWWKHTNLCPIGKPRITYCQRFFFRSEQRSISRNTRQTTTIVDDSDGVHGRVRVAARLCFVLAAQARKLSLSASLGWAEEAHKRHARNSDGDAAIFEVLNNPPCFRSLCLLVVALGRSSWWQIWAWNRHDLFRGTIAGVRFAMICM